MARPSTAEALSFEGAELDPHLPRKGTLVAGRYELGELIGEGGMSAVYVAWDRRLRREVAFKLLSPRLASAQDIVARFVNEARTLARLDSPHVVQVFDAGMTGEPGGLPLPFMVLELLKGSELRSFTDGGAYDDYRVIGWMLEVCEGLSAAHGAGVIHRDLKPENLFLVQQPDGGEHIKVLDFGIARSMQVERGVTMDGEGVGSPGYMSPEQLRDASSVDQRSDIWSLGVVMYELFGRQSPFRAASPIELCTQILNAPIAPLGELRPDLDPELAAVVDRCLEREPEARFQNILELAEALLPFARPSNVVATARIRRRLSPHIELLPEDSPALSEDEDERPFAATSGVWRKKLARRVWISRSVGLVLLAAVVGLLLAAAFPRAAETTRNHLDAGSRHVRELARNVLSH